MKTKPKKATYSSIFNYIYQIDGSSKERLKEFSNIEICAWHVIKTFKLFKGFDWWFEGEIETEHRNNIFRHLVKMLKNMPLK